MTLNDILILISGFLGGGLVATVISVWAQSHAARRAAEREHLADALRYLYGPVLWSLQHSQRLMEHCSSISDAYREEFIDKKFAESARETVEHEAGSVIEMENEFFQMVRTSLHRIVTLAEEQPHLIDIADIDVFHEIRHQIDRMRVEYDAPQYKDVRFLLYRKLGSVSSFKPEWLKAIEVSYKRMSKRYHRLSGTGRRRS